MSKFRVLRRAAIAAVALVAVAYFEGFQSVRDAYPADPFKAEALAKCLATDPGFIRFFANDRARCYARQPRVTGDYSPGSPPAQASVVR